MKNLKDKFFKPKNAGEITEHFSPKTWYHPAGEYKLVITSFSTGKHSWSYTQGLVYKVGNNEPIFEIRRNYSSFPFSWIDHPNKFLYLIVGSNYQGHTILEIESGRRSDFLPLEAKQGIGFCWAEHRFDTETRILTVLGCVWACSYEFRFYDFSDPMKGCPEIVLEKSCIYDDAKWPTFEFNGIIKTYETISDNNDEEEKVNNIEKPAVIKSIKTFERNGLKLIFLNEWVSDEEKVRRETNEINRKIYEEKQANFKATDPLYLAYIELVKDPVLSPDEWEGTGIIHDTWCPFFKEKEQRRCKRIVRHKGKKGYTIDLEWATVSGPIKLEVYKDGNEFDIKWFEHSVEGMNQAFETAKEIIKRKWYHKFRIW
jgi:hypothetical protein